MLYRLVERKLNIYLTTKLGQIDTTHGFELWRQLNRELDPKREHMDFHLKQTITALGRPASTLNDTIGSMENLQRHAQNYQANIGTALDDTYLAEILWAMLDSKTEEAAVQQEIAPGKYAGLRERLVAKKDRLAGRAVVAKAHVSNKMDVGAFTQQQHAAAAAATAQAPEADPWQGTADPWAAPPTAGDWKRPPPSLDAFGRAKDGGKAKRQQWAKPPLICNCCNGQGHPWRLCASPQGSGERKAGPQCNCCKGFGHVVAACA